MSTIVIDPGHGGYDYGSTNAGRLEKNDNLRLGLAVRDILKGMGYNVIMTRDTDVFVPLLDRSFISNRNNPDLFISLHRNGSTNSLANGIENFVYLNAPAINTRYAQNVLNKVAPASGMVNRGLKQEDFSVLRNTVAPAQLLEVGFITNTGDNQLFDKNFNAIANAIAQGISESLGAVVPPVVVPPLPPARDVIKGIQSTLNSRYGAGLVVDGIFGPNTRRAMVRGLQTELNKQYNAGLTVDGVFGPSTAAAIRTVRRGDRGNIVYLLQAMLYIKGFTNVGDLDGVFGGNTEQAIRSFQSSSGLTVDGLAGPMTFRLLFS